MRRTVCGLVLAGLALTGCGKDKPAAAPTPTPSTSAPPSTAPSASAQCRVPTALPAGTTLVTATVSGTTVTTEHHTWSVKVGGAVRIAVTADRADEVHVHSYDKKQDTVPGCPTAIDFVASIPGTVEVELENAGLHLFDLKAS